MYTGLTGSLRLKIDKDRSIPIAYISGWSIEDKTEMIETSRLDLTHTEALPGFQSWSASADGAIVFEASNSQRTLFEMKHRGEKIELQFFLNDTNINEATYFKGDCYIESLSVDLSAEDKGNISISVKGTGFLELYIKGAPVRGGVAPPTYVPTFKFEIRGDNLWVVTTGDSHPFGIDEKGNLILTL